MPLRHGNHEIAQGRPAGDDAKRGRRCAGARRSSSSGAMECAVMRAIDGKHPIDSGLASMDLRPSSSSMEARSEVRTSSHVMRRSRSSCPRLIGSLPHHSEFRACPTHKEFANLALRHPSPPPRQTSRRDDRRYEPNPTYIPSHKHPLAFAAADVHLFHAQLVARDIED